ncbi:MAG: aminopeptidase [Actinobacteria bacterium]|nr:aminopeptidase [Actinomycetota bacterium]
MKIYIITDLEGISGILTWEQAGVPEKGSAYHDACRLLTKEVNAAVEGCLAGGAKTIVVLDGHMGGLNFIMDELHAGAEYITGPGRIADLPGLDNSFDAVILIGFHAMAGTKGAILDHTQMSTRWLNYYVNGRKMGEIGQQAVQAGHFAVPVVFVSGDLAATREARELLGDIKTVAVKEGYSRTAARCLPPVRARELIREGVKESLATIDKVNPYVITPPLEITLECQNTDVADAYEISGCARIDGRTVSKTVDSALEIVRL